MIEHSASGNLATLPDHVTGLGPAQGHDPHYREPPVNYDAEQALLGAILASNAAYERVADFLLPEHFADPVNGRVYQAIGRLLEQGRVADAVTLKGFFERNEELAEIGGANYLVELQQNYVSIVNARDYAETIHDLYLRRQLITLGQDVVNDAFDQDLDDDSNRQIERAEQRLFNLAESGQIEGGLREFRSAVMESVAMAEAALKRSGHVAGLTTGFDELDKCLGGLHPSDLIILAARPSMGKSALATNIAFNAARSLRRERDHEGNEFEQKEVVAFFSLEMSSEQLATRILSAETRIRSDSIRRGEIRNEDFDKLFEASRELYTLPLFMDDTPAITLPAMRTRARRLKRQQGLSLIVVDYLQLMQAVGGNRNDGRVQEVSEITRGLKALAKELNVPVIALSQLSRQTEQRDDKRPQLADLRESGSIEQDADVVMFIFREEYYLSREKPSQRATETEDKFLKRQQDYEQRLVEARNKAEILVAKQRHGPIATIDLVFDGQYTRFDNFIGDDHLPDAQW